MFCPNCGIPAAEDAVFCANCGTKLTQEEAQPLADAPIPAEIPAETPAEIPQTPVEVVAEAPAQTPEELPWEPADAPVFAQASFDAAPKKKKSKKKLAVTLAVIGVLLIAAAIVTLVFWGPISGFFVKTFGSPEDYFQHVEKQAAEDSADTVSSYYNTFLASATTYTAVEGTMRLQVSDKLIQLLAAGGADADLSWLEDLTIDYETVVDGEWTMLNMMLAISGTDITDVVMIMNTTTGEYYIGMPSLSSEYLHYDPSDYYMPGMMVGSVNPYKLLSDEAFIKALPDEKTVNTLVRRYLQIIAENATNVEKESDTLEIGDLEQKVTVLEYELTQKGLMKIAKAVLKEAKTDKDLKKVINDMSKYLEEQGVLDDASTVYDDFQDAVEEALDSLGDVNASSETLLVLTDYVDGKSEIIGRKLSVQGQTILEYATITKGKEFATEWKFGNGNAVFRGEGTIDGDVREGKYVLNVQGVDYLQLAASYDEKKLADGQLNGRFLLTPSATMLQAMDLDSQLGNMISSMNLGLELVLSSDQKKGSSAINLVSGNEVLLGISAEATVTDAKEVAPPDAGNWVDFRYADDWATGLDLDKVISALRKTKVPAEITDSLEDAIDQMNNPYGGYYDDYYNDYYSNYYYG